MIVMRSDNMRSSEARTTTVGTSVHPENPVPNRGETKMMVRDGAHKNRDTWLRDYCQTFHGRRIIKLKGGLDRTFA